MKTEKIKILHLEDSETDVVHIHRVLTRGEIHFTSRVVDTRGDYIAALRDFSPEVVISDHSMPDFNSVEALDILRTSGIDIPFILLTGAVSEEFAVDVMIRGADDYILKDRPRRLPSAILNAIEKYNNRRERERQATELRNIFDGSLDVLCSIDAEGRFINVSAAAEKTWGYKPAELAGKKYTELVHVANHQVTRQIAADIMAGLTVTNFENHYVHKNGNIVPMTWSARWDAEAQVMYAVARDATEKVKAEKAILTERKRLMDLFMNAPVNMCMFTGEDHVFEMVNKVSEKQIKRDVIGKKYKDAFPEFEQQGFVDLMDRVYRTGEAFEDKEMLVKVDQNKDGKLVDNYLNILVEPYLDGDGNVEGVCYFGVHVTEQVLARKKIEESYEMLKSAESLQSSILNSLPAQIALLDNEGKIIAVNQSWKNFAKENGMKSPTYGVGESYIGNADDVRHRGPDTVDKMAQGILEVIGGAKKLFSMDYRCDSPTEKRWFTARGAPTIYGNERGAVIIHTNITDRKLAEDKIKESEANLAAIIENADAHVYSLDRELRYITFNSAIKDSLEAIYGIEIRPGDKAYGFLGKIDPTEAEWWEKIYNEALTGKKMHFVKDYSIPGTPAYLNFSINPILENGNIIGLSCFARDITEKKLSEIEMGQLTRRLSLATTSAGMGTWDWDIKNNILLWDDAMYRLYNVNPSEFRSVYDGWFSRVHPEDKGQIAKEMSMALNEGKKYDTTFRIFLDDISIRYIKATGIIEKDESGTAIRMIGLNWDITDKKEVENKIIELNENLENKIVERTAQLKEAIKELEAFNYTVSHDLQAPLRIISGFANIIVEDYSDKVDDTCREYLNYIADNSKKMGQLIKDLLAFARLGDQAVNKKETNMLPIVDSIITQAKMANPDLITSITIHELPSSFSDEALITQVWNNLIMNAIKYSSKKENPAVEIGSRLIDNSNVYYVKDNGAGFDMKYADKLFGVFKRLHLNEDFEGSGIGLATVHRILTKHGGKVWAEAKINEGATFYFTLPPV